MSTRTVHHVHIPISPLLALPAAEFDDLCDGTLSDDSGRRLSAAEARQALEALVAKGQLIVPAAGCDHWDSKTGCLGHAKEEITGHFQRQAMTLSNKLICQEAVTLDEAAYQDGFADARRLAVTLTAQADARIANLEAALHTAAHLLGDMHDNSPACLFNGAKGEDVGCLACLAQMRIEKEMERQ